MEHAVIRRLAEVAGSYNLNTIKIRWRPSERNDAACHFFAGIPGATFVADENAATEAKAAADREAELAAAAAFAKAKAQRAAATSACSQMLPGAAEGGEEVQHQGAVDRMAIMMAAPVPAELAHLSKRQLKREMRRRVHEANKQDKGWRQSKLKARAATREAARQKAATVEPLSVNAEEKISQHRPFGNKPAPGFVLIPVASAAGLNVAVTGIGHRRVNTIDATPTTAEADGAAVEIRYVRATRGSGGGSGGRLVALHHETVRAVALGLSAFRAELSEYMRSARGTPVEGMLHVPSDSGGSIHQVGGVPAADVESSAGAILIDSERDRGELSLEAFREYYMLREQARDRVKELIQQNNPGQYEHVTHLVHSATPPN